MQHEKHLFHQLAEPLLEGFAWGSGAQQHDGKLSDDLFDQWTAQFISAEMARDLADLNTKADQPNFIDAVDAFVDQHGSLEDLREFFIDLAVLQVIVGSASREDDFLDSDAWEDMENKTEDRGSELLNLLVYLKDCNENEVKPNISDFLHEFLLVDEDDFQEEMGIYEVMVSNEDLVMGEAKQIVEVGNQQKADMEELFTPAMLFFKQREKKPGKLTFALLNFSQLPHVHTALYRLLAAAPKFL